jgi:hypothetical protein
VVSAILVCGISRAEQAIVQPNVSTMRFEGPALRLPCVAELKIGQEAFADGFAQKSLSERSVCLSELLTSLSPEPEFTTADFERSLTPEGGGGGLRLAPEPSMESIIFGRLGVNSRVSLALEELAHRHLIQDPAAIGPLIRCLNYPLIEVANVCRRTLSYLTRHSYGDVNIPPTVEGRETVIRDWTELAALRAKQHLVFDSSMAETCREFWTAAEKGLVASGVAPMGLSKLDDVNGFDEAIYSAIDEDLRGGWTPDQFRVKILLFRPGIFQPRSHTQQQMRETIADINALGQASYRESFPALDLELYLEVRTEDVRKKQAAVSAVQQALVVLRAMNAAAEP